MTDRSAARERRIRQFEHYFGLMEHRARRLARSDCFVIFSVPMRAEMRIRLGVRHRFVQFAFTSEGFYADLPDTTLTPEEARQVIAERPEFGFALENPDKKLGERQFDPVQRPYAYHEQRQAAEDTAYLFFDLWRMPLRAWIKIRAAAFDGSHSWERGFSMG